MYTVTVKSRKILEGMPALKICAPLFIWMIAEFATFLVAVKVEPFAIILMFIVFFAIIPIVYCMRKKTAEFRGKESFIYEDVTVHAVGGELYIDDERVNLTYNESKTKIYIDDITTYEGKYGIQNTWAIFIGIVEEPYLEDFVRFLKEQGVQIHQEAEAGETDNT